MSKTIKLIPTNYSVIGLGVDANLDNPENALTGIDDDTSAKFSVSKSSSGTMLGGTVEFTKFVGPNGETVADIASKIEHVNSISFKTKYQADPPTLPGEGIMVNGWGRSNGYSASPSPQIVEIPFNKHDDFASVDEYWQAAVKDDSGIVMAYYAAPKDGETAGIVNIYGSEMEINYEPKEEPDPSKINPNSTAEVIYGDSGSTKTYDVEVKDLRVENGKLNGTAVGVAQKSFTGRLDQIKFSFTDVPFDGVGGGGSGGGSGVETLVVTGEVVGSDPTNPRFTVTSTSMTFDELNDAILDGKPVLCFCKLINPNEFNQFVPISLSYIIGPIATDDQTPALFEIRGVSSIDCMKVGAADTGYKIAINYMQLSWTSSDDLPRLNVLSYRAVSAD